MNDQMDSTGRYFLDCLADIPDNAPEKLHETTHAFQQLAKRGAPFSHWSTDAAVRTHNHRLLRWIMRRPESRVGGDAHYPAGDLLWTVVHSRNRHALQYCPPAEIEHFEEVALSDDTNFLGAMRAQCGCLTHLIQGGETVRTEPFLHMINGDHDAGEAGFLWLWRAGLVDREALTTAQHDLIRERYGRRVAKKYNPSAMHIN